MNRPIRIHSWGIGLTFLILIHLSPHLGAGEVMKEGAAIGRWTMDLDAARKLAKKESLAIFLDFTGSDWCGWCIRMDRQVFSKEGWLEFSADKLALVKIDFPRNQGLVPERYRRRNIELQSEFGVGGYPTYILLDSDGEAELGRLGAGVNKTLQSFEKEVMRLFRRSNAGVGQFAAKLPVAVAERYVKSSKQLRAAHKQYDEWLSSKPKMTAETLDLFLRYNSDITKLSNEVEEIESQADAKAMTSDVAGRYLALYADLHKTRNALNSWLQSHPEDTVASNDKQVRLQTRIQKISRQLTEF